MTPILVVSTEPDELSHFTAPRQDLYCQSTHESCQNFVPAQNNGIFKKMVLIDFSLTVAGYDLLPQWEFCRPYFS